MSKHPGPDTNRTTPQELPPILNIRPVANGWIVAPNIPFQELVTRGENQDHKLTVYNSIHQLQEALPVLLAAPRIRCDHYPLCPICREQLFSNPVPQP
jgi:hypothetical protein